MMRVPAYEGVKAEGELGFRLAKNFARLEDTEYRPDVLFEIEKNGWAGDWEGRTVLALVLLSRTTGQKAAYLDEILDKLEEEMNPKGYLKGILPDGEADEQQLSGHNWLLRGLLEHYLWTGSERNERMARKIVENLYLPVRPLYKNYPTDPAMRSMDGEASGRIGGNVVYGWHLSTDIGCAFMSMDALSQYYSIFGDERVADLLWKMFEAFCRIDFMKASMQTHASLSACRGLIRFYKCTERTELLDFVISFFDFYMKHGMTENYANFNWFGRPLWTEPCAIVDSYLVALELWKETGKLAYLQTAHRIYYNALGHGQRNNGGFGCDDCAGPGPAGAFLRAQRNHYEACWCCSMRGAEGLTKAALHSVLEDGSRIYIAGCFSGEYELADARLTVRSGLPREGHLSIRISGCQGLHKFYFYIPEGADRDALHLQVRGREVPAVWEDGYLTVSVLGCGDVRLVYPICLQKRGTVSKETPEGSCTYWHGDLLLGAETKDAVTVDGDKLAPQAPAVYSDGQTVLQPVGQSIYFEREELLNRSLQVLFNANAGGDN